MSMEKLADSLHRLERAVLPALAKEPRTDEAIAKAAELSLVEVRRALQWLENKGMVKVEEEATELVQLGKNGQRYAKEKLPERRVLEAVAEKARNADALAIATKLSPQEVSVSIGTLKKAQAISVSSGKPPVISAAAEGKKLLKDQWPLEAFLNALQQPHRITDLSKEARALLSTALARRELVEVVTKKTLSASLTKEGAAVDVKGADRLADRITPEMLRDSSWQRLKFRSYDLTSQAPKMYGGRKQPYRMFLDEVRRKFMSMGFKELTGPIVETEFWNMDALFMPQFHSARDIHDAYYVKEPKYAAPLPHEIVEKVKHAHENGIAGSRGWRYSFDTRRTHRHILRTQDTSISPRMLSSPELKVPGKYFQIVRCFRYDVIDATHLADFNQTGGFVVEEGINLRHLFGLLKLLAEEFCETDQIKITPAYFPFTEPSASLYAKHPDIGWIELAGSGIFRPEMCAPLGVKAPVIAWGVGLERLAMFKLGMTDIRQLFSHDLHFLRNAKVV